MFARESRRTLILWRLRKIGEAIYVALFVVVIAAVAVAVISYGAAHEPTPPPGACDTGGVWMGDCSDQ